MKRTTLLSFGSALLAIGVMSVAGYGCGDDDDAPVTPKDGGVPITETGPLPESSTPDTAPPGPPPPPTLGTQIDRFGRPAVNTALTAPFNPDDTAAGAKKNAYNTDGNQAGWVAAHRAEIAGNLAVLDAVDGVCGNQAAINMDATTAVDNITTYGALAGFLADDRQWMKTDGNSAGQYLAVELAALGVVNTDRGGRTLAYDVIDTTYTALTTGLTGSQGDGVAAVAAKTTGAAFPYLAAGQ